MYSILRPWSNARLANIYVDSCPGVLFWVDLDQGNTLDLFDAGIDFASSNANVAVMQLLSS